MVYFTYITVNKGGVMYKITYNCHCGATHELEAYGDTRIDCGCGYVVEYMFDPKVDEYIIKEGEYAEDNGK